MDYSVFLAHLFTLYLYLHDSIYATASSGLDYLHIYPEIQCMQVPAGEKVTVHCMYIDLMHDFKPHIFLWQRQPPNNSGAEKAIPTDTLARVYQLQSKVDTKSLIIQEAQVEDSGFYNCISQKYRDNRLISNVYIHVYTKPQLLQCDKVFICSEKRKIPCSMVCDGTVDCKNGFDEHNCISQGADLVKSDTTIPNCVKKADVSPKLQCNKVFECSQNERMPCGKMCDGTRDCINGLDEFFCPDTVTDVETKEAIDSTCFGKFQCRNGLCVNWKNVCDVTRIDHCGDASDEENCPRVEVRDDIEIYTKDRQMDWLKTTVYTVIACTVAVVLLIAIIVVAIFRIRMKRSAIRRPLQHADIRRRSTHNCDGHTSRRALRNSGVMEHEPFISAPSTATFGNLIVNVNSGTHFIPSTELNAVFRGPPTYSEVIAECQRQADERHSPPPDYSTIDRNPRPPGDSALPLDRQQESGIHNTRIRDPCSDPSINRESHSIQSFSANEIQITSLGPGLRPEGTNSLGRRQYGNNGYRNRQVRNVRAHPLPQRPKQLQVRNGQIVLDGHSSGSSSPETVNRNTQTTTHDFRDLQQALKQGQIQVDRGQVILRSQPADAAPEAGEPEREGACSVQLEVIDGQIVFKAS